MKNIKRIFLLIALVVIASKVLFSDFSFTKTENEIALNVSHK